MSGMKRRQPDARGVCEHDQSPGVAVELEPLHGVVPSDLQQRGMCGVCVRVRFTTAR